MCYVRFLQPLLAPFWWQGSTILGCGSILASTAAGLMLVEGTDKGSILKETKESKEAGVASVKV